MKNTSLFSEYDSDCSSAIIISIQWQLKKKLPLLDNALSSTVSDLVCGSGFSLAHMYVSHVCVANIPSKTLSTIERVCIA